ncbi:23S rRNA (adenine(2030)-N(6))-methyltransferase RlmJ [Acidocella sp.]|uniref:23S rRNA (adenine(2030)-N(6))-methyltransferase RlmJ n=1 Tax=Acidocella sp. TaxID=50710 RepID=UPI002633BB7F|nr:23S rRNA (adenine(2030)-N(6))-methyltransferase RlmJ [Acidocella sp.]
MNYRHIFHAGNFADVMKHALYIELMRALQRKDKPFLILDTHAGIGRYDVSAAEAEKTGEWRSGIGLLLDDPPPALAAYVELVKMLGLYPGSPCLVAGLMRPKERLVACELHAEDAQTLRRAMRHTPNVAVHFRDGYEAVSAFLPPPEKRGLILIDPPFERTDEFAVVARALEAGWRKFPSGVFCVWYPIKHRAPVRAFFETLKQGPVRDMVAFELLKRPDTDPNRLNGCGLLIINPPFGFELAAQPILAACAQRLGEAGASFAIERLADE